MKIKITGCRILVRPFELADHDPTIAAAKKAGIAIPEFSERKEQVNVDQGVVLQIGNKCHEDYVDGLEVGDTVGYSKFGGKFFPDPDNKDKHLLVINDEDVICIYKD